MRIKLVLFNLSFFFFFLKIIGNFRWNRFKTCRRLSNDEWHGSAECECFLEVRDVFFFIRKRGPLQNKIKDPECRILKLIYFQKLRHASGLDDIHDDTVLATLTRHVHFGADHFCRFQDFRNLLWCGFLKVKERKKAILFAVSLRKDAKCDRRFEWRGWRGDFNNAHRYHFVNMLPLDKNTYSYQLKVRF